MSNIDEIRDITQVLRIAIKQEDSVAINRHVEELEIQIAEIKAEHSIKGTAIFHFMRMLWKEGISATPVQLVDAVNATAEAGESDECVGCGQRPEDQLIFRA